MTNDAPLERIEAIIAEPNGLRAEINEALSLVCAELRRLREQTPAPQEPSGFVVWDETYSLAYRGHIYENAAAAERAKERILELEAQLRSPSPSPETPTPVAWKIQAPSNVAPFITMDERDAKFYASRDYVVTPLYASLPPETPSPLLDKAIRLAMVAHAGQMSRDDVEPQLCHVLRVMAAGTTEDERVVGALHDVLEDSAASITDFPVHIVEAVRALTRPEGESYFEYITRLQRNALATAVKINDLRDNIRRGAKYPSLVKRYEKALAQLSGTPEGETPWPRKALPSEIRAAREKVEELWGAASPGMQERLNEALDAYDHALLSRSPSAPSETSAAPAALRERILEIALRNRDACGYNCDCHDEIAALFASLPAPPRTTE